MKTIKAVAALACFLGLFANSGAQAQALAAGTRVTDAATCEKIPAKGKIDACKTCVAKPGQSWVVAKGCVVARAAAPVAPAKPAAPALANGTKVTDAATCDRITAKANIGACKTCVTGGKTWTTGTGSAATACAAK